MPKVPKVVDLKDFPSPKVHLKLPKVVEFDSTYAINSALKIWDECQIADSSPVARYLASRGFKVDSADSISCSLSLTDQKFIILRL